MESTEIKSEKKSRNYQIDFFRFIFAVLVILQHSQPFAKDLADKPSWFGAGHIAVYFFFIVSGFLMVSHYFRKNDAQKDPGRAALDFLKSKISVIAIDYFAAFAIYRGVDFAIQLMTGKISSFNSVMKFIIVSIPESLGITATGLTQASNGPVWYISAMLIAMPLLYYMLCKNKGFFMYVFAPFACVFLLGWRYYTYDMAKAGMKPFFNVTEPVTKAFLGLLCGVIAFVIYDKIKNKKFTTAGRFIITLAELTGYAAVIYICLFQSGSSQIRLCIHILLVPLLALTFSQESWIGLLFKSKLFYALGKFSFPLYLSHGLVIKLLMKIETGMGYYQEVLLLIVLSCLLALVEYFGIRLFILLFRAVFKKGTFVKCN